MMMGTNIGIANAKTAGDDPMPEWSKNWLVNIPSNLYRNNGELGCLR